MSVLIVITVYHKKVSCLMETYTLFLFSLLMMHGYETQGNELYVESYYLLTMYPCDIYRNRTKNFKSLLLHLCLY